MATRFSRNETGINAVKTGYEGSNYATIEIPSCGIEDLDKAMFNLFNEDLPLFYEQEGVRKRVPVIFATGERFALLKRKKPLRDRNGTIILPLISITRSSVVNNPPKGSADNQMITHTIKRKVATEDVYLQQLKNKENAQNAKNTYGQEEGLVKTDNTNKDFSLKPKLSSDNIYEFIEMPPVKYIGANYEVTLWTNFAQEGNRLIESIMASYNLNAGQQFRIDSDKPYWFVAFAEDNFSMDTSFSESTDNERYVKYTMTFVTNGYIVAPNIMGGKTALRSFISAPSVSFNTSEMTTSMRDYTKTGTIDNTPDAHIFDDLQSEFDPLPGSGVGINSAQNALNVLTNNGGNISNNDIRNIKNVNAIKPDEYGSNLQTNIVISKIKGETIYKKGINIDF